MFSVAFGLGVGRKRKAFMSSLFTRRQWCFIYLGICLALLPAAGILAIIKPPESVVAGVLMGAALLVPIVSLLGPVWRIPHAWVHVTMVFVLLLESVILAGVVNGANRGDCAGNPSSPSASQEVHQC